MPDSTRQGGAISYIKGCALKMVVGVENIGTFEPLFISFLGVYDST